MAPNITASHEFLVGQPTVVEGLSPDGRLLVVFEDDGETGYFYAVDPSCTVQSIQDALHIYNVSNVADKELSSKVEIGWSADSRSAVLLINKHPHAVFDFQFREACCRTGFPPSSPESVWASSGHAWRDEALRAFA